MIMFIHSSEDEDTSTIHETEEARLGGEEAAELPKEEAKGIVSKSFCFKYKKYINICIYALCFL